MGGRALPCCNLGHGKREWLGYTGKSYSDAQSLASAVACQGGPGGPYLTWLKTGADGNLGGPSGTTSDIFTFASPADEQQAVDAYTSSGSYGNGDGCMTLGPGWAYWNLEAPGDQSCQYVQRIVGGQLGPQAP